MTKTSIRAAAPLAAGPLAAGLLAVGPLAAVLVVAGLCGLPLPAQNASYTYFGAGGRVGCSPVGTPIQHTATNLPQLGTTFVVAVPTSNGDCSYLCNLSFFAIGLSDVAFQGVPLPVPVGGAGSNCGALRISLDLIEAMPFGPAGSTVAAAMPIPATPSLAGFEFYQQPFSFTFILGGFNSMAFGRAGHGTVGY